MVERAAFRFRVHAHVECRTADGAWWKYASPVVEEEPRLIALLRGDGSPEDDLVGVLGIPGDVSPEVRAAYTLRVESDDLWLDAPRTVAHRDAAKWLASGRSGRWAQSELGAERITDPAFIDPTWLDTRELAQAIHVFELMTDDLGPATWNALREMMHELERDFDVRVVCWFESIEMMVTGMEATTANRSRSRAHRGAKVQ